MSYSIYTRNWNRVELLVGVTDTINSALTIAASILTGADLAERIHGVDSEIEGVIVHRNMALPNTDLLTAFAICDCKNGCPRCDPYGSVEADDSFLIAVNAMPWFAQHANLITVAYYLVEKGADAESIAHFIEKPWNFEDEFRAAREELGDDNDGN